MANNNIIEPAEMQTPNMGNTEVQQNVQDNNKNIQPALGNTSTNTVASISNHSTPATQPTTQTSSTPVMGQTQTAPNMGVIEREPTLGQTEAQVQDQTQPQTQTNPVVYKESSSSVSVRIPSDFNDATVQGYLDEYKAGVEINDYQAQINALTAIDKYRTDNGYDAIYTQTIYELVNQRKNKIENAIREYESDIADAIYSGDTALAQEIGQQLETYKRNVNYSETMDNASNYLKDIEYKSTYDSVISGIVNELLTAKFSYDPSEDEALLKAQSHATNVVYEGMNAKGILDSTMTAQIITKTVNELIPVYEKMAKEEFYANIERLQSMASFIMNIENNQYDRWLNNVQLRLQYYEAQRDEMSYQWDRVNNLGYVDNEASIILGVAPRYTISSYETIYIRSSAKG